MKAEFTCEVCNTTFRAEVQVGFNTRWCSRKCRYNNLVYSLVGKKIGILSILSEGEPRILKDVRGEHVLKTINCVCDCGNRCVIVATRVKTGKIKSCGCLSKKSLELGRKQTHGLHNHILNSIWTGIKQRCYNPKNQAYKNYGGRGIYVCDEWFNSLPVFYEWCMRNGWEEGLHIDRINNSGNYEPSNCRITTPQINSNNRRDTRMVMLDGELTALSLACNKLELKHPLIYARMQRGKTFDEAIKM